MEEDQNNIKDELESDLGQSIVYESSTTNLAPASELDDEPQEEGEEGDEDEMVEDGVDMQEGEVGQYDESMDEIIGDVEENEETEEEKIQNYWHLHKAFSIDEYPPFQSLQQIENVCLVPSFL